MKTTLEPWEIIKMKSQLPEILINFTDGVRKRLRQGDDLCIAITSPEGMGKSNLGVLIGFLVDLKFDLVKNVCYLPSSEQITKQFNAIKKFQALLIDESCNALHKFNWMKKKQKELVANYTTERWQSKLSIFLNPRFKDFSEAFRNHRIRIWINIILKNVEKGYAHAIVYCRDDDKDSEEPWNVKQNFKLKQKKFRKKKISERKVSDILQFERGTINYLFDFRFPVLPKELEDSYKHLKIESRNNQPQEDEDANISNTEKKYLRATISLIKEMQKIKPELQQLYFAEVTGLAKQTISRIIKQKVVIIVNE